MSGLLQTVQGIEMAAFVLLLGLALLLVVTPVVSRLALAWARFWAAVIIVIYLHRPWRVAIDRARREIV